MNMQNVSFKGFDNVSAVKTENQQGRCYVISARLNNEGINDLDKFQKLLQTTNSGDILTIHFEEVNNNFGTKNTIIDVNDIPLMTNGLDNSLPHEIKKELEKFTLPVAQDVVNLLKRIIKNPECKNTDVLEKTTQKSVESMCGMYKEIPMFIEFTTKLAKDQQKDGPQHTKNVATTIYEYINNQVQKYFE